MLLVILATQLAIASMQSPLFRLPRELRDRIYHFYVYEPEGYHFDFESRKFRAPGNRSIDLALSLTSRTVAAEMHHLALESNVLHFTTGYSEAGRLRAGHFNILFEQMEYHKITLLEALRNKPLGDFKSKAVDAKIIQRYPQFESLLPGLRWRTPLGTVSDRFPDDWGVAESYFRGFQDYVIELLSKETDFINTYVDFCDRKQRDNCYNKKHAFCRPELVPFVRSGFLLSSPKPWTIPSDDELAQLDDVRADSFRESPIWKRVKWRFSAAAVAIEFFKSLSPETLLRIRKVVLTEDRLSVGRPECHGLGLIQFCLQNANLRIEVSQEWRFLNLDRITAKVSDLVLQVPVSESYLIAGSVRFLRSKLIRAFYLASSLLVENPCPWRLQNERVLVWTRGGGSLV